MMTNTLVDGANSLSSKAQHENSFSKPTQSKMNSMRKKPINDDLEGMLGVKQNIELIQDRQGNFVKKPKAH